MISADDLCFIHEFWDLNIPWAINRDLIEDTNTFFDYEQYLVDFFWGSGDSYITDLSNRKVLIEAYKMTFRSTK